MEKATAEFNGRDVYHLTFPTHLKAGKQINNCQSYHVLIWNHWSCEILTTLIITDELLFDTWIISFYVQALLEFNENLCWKCAIIIHFKDILFRSLKAVVAGMILELWNLLRAQKKRTFRNLSKNLGAEEIFPSENFL